MIDSVIVTFKSEEPLGLDRYDSRSYAVVPADFALLFIEEPRIKDDWWDAKFRRKQWKETLDTIKSWGGAMVSISSFGIVVGEFSMRPYFISAEQYKVLLYERMA